MNINFDYDHESNLAIQDMERLAGLVNTMEEEEVTINKDLLLKIIHGYIDQYWEYRSNGDFED